MSVAELTRVIDTDRGPLLVTVQRMSDRYTTRELTSDDLLEAARVLFREAALMSRVRIVSAPMRAEVLKPVEAD